MYKVYSLPNCANCDNAKKLLDAKEIEYETLMIGVDIHRDDLLKMNNTIRSAPAIFKDNTYIGTYSDLRKLLEV